MRVLTAIVLGGIVGAAVHAQVPVPFSRGGMAPPVIPPGLVEQAPTMAGQVAPTGETLRTFDPQQVRVGWINRRWVLVHNGEVLKDFGPSEYDARIALRLIHELQLTQVGTVGAPNPVIEYWLSHGQPPRAIPRSTLRTVSLDPSRLRVEQVAGQWCVREGTRTLSCFGPNRAEAERAVAVFTRYGFNQAVLVGQVTPAMTIYLSGGRTVSRLQPASATAPQRFSRLVRNPDGSPRIERLAGGNNPPVQGLDGLDQIAPPVIPALHTSSGSTREYANDFRWRSPSFAAPPPTTPDGRVLFDWRQVSLRQDGVDWKLTCGGTVLASFGPSAHEARLALSALRHYRFSEQHWVGGDQPYLAYFAAPSNAPRSLMLGLNAEEFQPDRLEVKKLDSGYSLCQGERVVLRLRDQEADARQLLDAIKRNRYDRLCRIGTPGQEAMTFLVRTR